MKKKYFCDWWNNKGNSGEMALPILISILITVTISSLFFYNFFISIGGDEYNYSKDTYDYLEEISNTVIIEGVGINLTAIPEDVITYEIIKEKQGLVFKYNLDNNYGQFSIPITMNIKLSENFDIISKDSNYSSQEEYERYVKQLIIITSILIGCAVCGVILVLVLIICTITAEVSKKNKKKDGLLKLN